MTPKETDSLFTPKRFALFFAACVLCLYPDVIFGSGRFVFRDYSLLSYPAAFYHKTLFWQGEIPLWNPYNNCGIPFLAQWTALILYPFSLFYLLLPMPWSLSVFCLLHLWWAGFTMYWLARKWTGSNLSGAIAGVGYGVGGFTVGAMMWPSLVASLSWMPLVVYTGRKAFQRGGQWIAAATVIGSQQMIAGQPELILFTWCLITLFVVSDLWKNPKNGLIYLSRMTLCVVLISLLCAPQILPFFELLSISNRDVSTGSGGEWAMPETGWANFLVPLFYSHDSPSGVMYQFKQGLYSSYYCGVFTVILAILACFKVRDSRVTMMGLATMLSLILALDKGGYLFPLIRDTIPVLGFMRYPIKFVMIAIFTLPLLAAFGLRWFVHDWHKNSSTKSLTGGFIWLGTAVIILGLTQFERIYPLAPEPWTRAALNGAYRQLFLFLILMLGWAALKLQAQRARQLCLFGIVAVFFLDLATHTNRLNPTTTNAPFAPGISIANLPDPQPKLGQSRAILGREAYLKFHSTLMTDPGTGLIVSRLGLYMSVNIMDLIPSNDGFSPVFLKNESELRAVLHGAEPFPDPLADFMSASHLTSEESELEWNLRPTALPMVTGGQQPVFFDHHDDLYRHIISPEFAPLETVALYHKEAKSLGPENGDVTILDFTMEHSKLSIETESPDGGLVVISQIHTPGWKAFIGDLELPVLAANHAFQTIPVPAGKQTIEVIYANPAFRGGLLSAGIGLIALCVTWFRRPIMATKATA